MTLNVSGGEKIKKLINIVRLKVKWNDVTIVIKNKQTPHYIVTSWDVCLKFVILLSFLSLIVLNIELFTVPFWYYFSDTNDRCNAMDNFEIFSHLYNKINFINMRSENVFNWI